MTELPPLPEEYNIPATLVERWASLPLGHPLAVNLTKQDADNLFFALLKMAEAVGHLDLALVSWSNGSIEEANKQIGDSRRLVVESVNRSRQFLSGVMLAALGATSR